MLEIGLSEIRIIVVVELKETVNPWTPLELCGESIVKNGLEKL